VYAASLVQIGQEKGTLSQLEEEIGFVSSLIVTDRDFRQFLTSPSFSKERKKEFVQKVFQGNLSDDFINFLNVLIDNERQSALPDIYDAIKAMIDEANNRIRVTVVTPHGCEKATVDQITSELKNKYKKEIILNEVVKSDILGGIIIKIGDTVIDGSLAKDLKNINKNLINSKVRSEAAYED
jgi:F-type H+-transporting ATPase subunit delta